jgi:hypothetical protein
MVHRMKALPTHAPPPFTVTSMEMPHAWSDDWQEFRQKHGQWPGLTERTDPLYAVPEPALKCLAESGAKGSPLFAASTARAEQDYTSLCRKFHAVGSWMEQPIVFSLLTPSPPPPDEGLMQLANWSKVEQKSVRQSLKPSQEARLRLKGYVGWLLTEPAFLCEADELAKRWRALPAAQRPCFPLGRAVHVPIRPKGSTLAPNTVADFEMNLKTFLNRWGLVRMASWDLPEPQGPLLPNPLPPDSPALPGHGVHLVLPIHYPLQGDDGLLRQIFEFQRQFAREQGLEDSMAGLPHYKAYAGMFDVLHLERTIRSRFEGSPKPRGLVERIEEAAAAVLPSLPDLIRKYRKAVSACRRGKRVKIAWLRPRNR